MKITHWCILLLSSFLYLTCDAKVSVIAKMENITNGTIVAVTDGTDLMVTCSSNETDNTVSLTATNSDINITVYNDTMMYSKVFIVNDIMKRHNNIMLMCSDDNDTLSFGLDVQFPPEFVFEQANYAGIEGESLNITVRVTANPQLHTIHWAKDDMNSTVDNNMTTGIFFDMLDRDNGGRYYVSGSNGIGMGQGSFLLTVYYNITFEAGENDTVYTVMLDSGESYTINCSLSSVGSHPPATSVHIMLPNGSMVHTDMMMITGSMHGDYMCVASNAQQTVRFTYSIMLNAVTTTAQTMTSSPTVTPSTTPTAAGYTVSVSFGLLIVAIALLFIFG